MDYITTTNLRTQSSQLVTTLKKGSSVSLIHRSKIIGIIKPKDEPRALSQKDINEIKSLAQDLNLAKVSYNKREQIYKKHLTKKYG